MQPSGPIAPPVQPSEPIVPPVQPSAPEANITSQVAGIPQTQTPPDLISETSPTLPSNTPQHGHHGYSGGTPQNIQHVQLTYPPMQYSYPANTYYNVPFTRAANFHPYQSRPPVNSYYAVPSNSFSNFDNRLDYFRNNDYNNFAPSMDNAPYYNLNGFRPMI